jgi:sodium transport system permease protein
VTGAFRAVFWKELVDSLRDRRSLAGALLLPVVGPLMFALTFSLMLEKFDREKPVELPVVGRDRAPSLMDFLEQRGVILKDAPDEVDAAVRNGTVHCVLVVSESYPERFREGRPARLELVVDESNEDASTTRRRVRGLLEQYSRSIGALRLLARGVSPSLASPLDIDQVDLATPRRRAAQLLGMVPMFALLAAFMGGMNVAIDATAGERERGSLEPLLINPAPRLAVATGKWLVVVLHGIAILALTLAIFRLAVAYVPLEQTGITVELGARELVAIFGVALPIAPFAAALLMAVSIFSRSYKEAQTYLSIMVFVPMLPGFYLMVNPKSAETWMMWIPTFAQNVLAVDLLRGEAVAGFHVALASAVTFAAGVAILALVGRLLGRERIVFGR